MICQGRFKYFPSAAHIKKKRLKMKNHNFRKKEAENEEPKLQNKYG